MRRDDGSTTQGSRLTDLGEPLRYQENLHGRFKGWLIVGYPVPGVSKQENLLVEPREPQPT